MLRWFVLLVVALSIFFAALFAKLSAVVAVVLVLISMVVVGGIFIYMEYLSYMPKEPKVEKPRYQPTKAQFYEPVEREPKARLNFAEFKQTVKSWHLPKVHFSSMQLLVVFLATDVILLGAGFLFLFDMETYTHLFFTSISFAVLLLGMAAKACLDEVETDDMQSTLIVAAFVVFIRLMGVALIAMSCMVVSASLIALSVNFAVGLLAAGMLINDIQKVHSLYALSAGK